MKFALHILKKIVLVLLAAVLFGWFVMALWNWLMPAVFPGVGLLDFPHAIGLLVLSRILFGGFRHGGHGRWHAHWHGHDKWHDKWHQRWHEKLEKMSSEEREKFRKGMQGGWRDERNHEPQE